MASIQRKLSTNVAGDFFVDDTCIDCAACRWIAPQTFDSHGDYSRVYRQPKNEEERLKGQMALLACPTGSIGTTQKEDLTNARSAFPRLLSGGVYHCGYHHRSSFGATSYLIVRPQGNILVDSPRFTKDLVKNIEKLGGIETLFLTHKDDVSDHQKFRDHFGCERILHEGDLCDAIPTVEKPLEGIEPVQLDEEVVLLPVPGHTKGSAVLLYGEKVLFSGDHLFWDNTKQQLRASRRVCWHDWGALFDSMERLADYKFEWLLPGHGWPAQRPAAAMGQEMQLLLERMKNTVKTKA